MYTRVNEHIWRDTSFLNLDTETKLLYMYLLTCPHSNLIGLFYLPKQYIACDLNVSLDSIDRGIDTLSKGVSIEYSEGSKTIFLCDFLKSNPLSSDKQVSGAIKILGSLPNYVPTEKFKLRIEENRQRLKENEPSNETGKANRENCLRLFDLLLKEIEKRMIEHRATYRGIDRGINRGIERVPNNITIDINTTKDINTTITKTKDINKTINIDNNTTTGKNLKNLEEANLNDIGKEFYDPYEKERIELEEIYKKNPGNLSGSADKSAEEEESKSPDFKEKVKEQGDKKNPDYKQKKEEKINYDEYLEKWNELASELELPAIKTMSDNRKAKLKTRLKEPEFNFDEILSEIRKQKFLHGKNPRGWVVDFDFVIRSEETYLKILENKYKESKNQTSKDGFDPNSTVCYSVERSVRW